MLLYYTPAPAIKVMPGAFGRLSVVFMGDEVQPVVGILDKAPSAGKGRVILLDGRTMRDSEQIMAAYPVEWTRTA